ncbi:unannotated protein [freshwater metagenome]|uniref:Unannotated protein n=1 Tax=freshwater metagenome TaxID=449393 RepID=A0A6J6QC61_9ZZZZ
MYPPEFIFWFSLVQAAPGLTAADTGLRHKDPHKATIRETNTALRISRVYVTELLAV